MTDQRACDIILLEIDLDHAMSIDLALHMPTMQPIEPSVRINESLARDVSWAAAGRRCVAAGCHRKAPGWVAGNGSALPSPRSPDEPAPGWQAARGSGILPRSAAMRAFDESIWLRVMRRTDVHLDAQAATEAHQRGRKITARGTADPTGVAVHGEARLRTQSAGRGRPGPLRPPGHGSRCGPGHPAAPRCRGLRC